MKTEAIHKLTAMLMDQTISSSVIQDALSLICESFSFSSGAVYETDDIQYFYRKECCEGAAYSLPAEIPYKITESKKEAQASIYSIRKKACSSSLKMHLLNLFHTEYMLVVPLNQNEVQGFLVFTKNPAAIELCASEQRDLFIMTGLISRYIIARIDDNKAELMKKTYESIMDSTGIDIYVNDFHTHEILYVNKSMAKPYGGKQAFEGRKCWEVLFPGQTGPCDFCPQKHILKEDGKPSSVYTWDYQRAFDGSWFRVFSSAFYWTDGRLAHVVSSADITDNKQKEELIEYMANYDELTALPNHRKLLRDGNAIINTMKEQERMFVLFFDIDGFKAINDTFGHDAGDAFLVELSKFFKRVPMLKDCVYRYGGDEFVAVLHGSGLTRMNIDNLSRFIHHRFEKQWMLEQGSVKCDVSIGVACYGVDADTMKELLYIADMAMYQAKKQGQGNICYGREHES